MPKWLRTYFYSHSPRFHFIVSLVLASLSRATCSYFVYGPQALDDFNHAVTPAFQWFSGVKVEVPGYRSHLLIWILGGLMRLAQRMGLDTPLAELRACHFGLGVLSLFGVYGTYLMVRKSSSRVFAATSLYLVAVFPLMPFLSTRTFGESVATGFVLLGFGLIEDLKAEEDPSLWQQTFGYLALGIATLFRFQVGVLFVVYWTLQIRRKGWTACHAGWMAGVTTLMLAGGIDHFSGKPWLSTLMLYLKENSGGARDFGVQPWYTTWFLFLGLALFPLSLIFWRSIPSLWRKHGSWLIPVLFFVALHSAIPHKEERFLYPILGLEMWILAWLWSAGARQKWGRWVFSPIMFFLVGPVLVALCTINSQEGSIAPQALISSKYPSSMIVYYQAQEGLFHFKNFFVRKPMTFTIWNESHLGPECIDQTLREHPNNDAIAIVTSAQEKLPELLALTGQSTTLAHCQEIVRTGSWLDRLLYTLNPNHNQRRRPTWHMVCLRESLVRPVLESASLSD